MGKSVVLLLFARLCFITVFQCKNEFMCICHLSCPDDFLMICIIYTIDAGNILLNGKDFKTYSLREIRELIGYVPQEPYLYIPPLNDGAPH